MSPSRPVPPTGSVAFTVLGTPLAEPGLRVLMDPVEGTVEVVVHGLPVGSDGVELCPVAGLRGRPDDGRCVVATAGTAVRLAVGSGVGGGSDGGSGRGLPGVLLRLPAGSPGTGIRVAEVTFTYRPGADSVTVVTPPLPPHPTPGGCPGGPCEMSLELSPTGRGTFELDADGGGRQPQLTLRSGRDGAGSSRVVSVVEGGGRLSIRSTVEGPAGVSLTIRNQGPAELPPLELALVWPALR